MRKHILIWVISFIILFTGYLQFSVEGDDLGILGRVKRLIGTIDATNATLDGVTLSNSTIEGDTISSDGNLSISSGSGSTLDLNSGGTDTVEVNDKDIRKHGELYAYSTSSVAVGTTTKTLVWNTTITGGDLGKYGVMDIQVFIDSDTSDSTGDVYVELDGTDVYLGSLNGSGVTLCNPIMWADGSTTSQLSKRGWMHNSDRGNGEFISTSIDTTSDFDMNVYIECGSSTYTNTFEKGYIRLYGYDN
ncbi:MAG: hypothetical protein GWN01_13935 [Nitrosopumilaceae archaeon]|nr:hypothetical protein [Nitrosopumilaceae archaeon]NIU88379.1 hypothetical protein [Nitrosopumilaceae archaeon]NIV66660.1 hypothetical protein [Nitrosopumilaceae archaeon]NIX62564.1 hypothetical protein [Nitrosopumilaceae archaeon]